MSWHPPGFGLEGALPMRPTEAFTTPLDGICQGLRIVDKFHPPGLGNPYPSYSEVFGLKGQEIDTGQLDNTLIERRPIR